MKSRALYSQKQIQIARNKQKIMPAANVYNIHVDNSAFRSLIEAHIECLQKLNVEAAGKVGQTELATAYYRAIKCRQSIKLKRISTYQAIPNLVIQDSTANFKDLDQQLQRLSTTFALSLRMRFGMELPMFESDPRKTLSESYHPDPNELPPDWHSGTVGRSGQGNDGSLSQSNINYCPFGVHTPFCSSTTNRCVLCRGPVFPCPHCQVVHSQNIYYYNGFTR